MIPTDPAEFEIYFAELRSKINRDNVLALLGQVPCPQCSIVGKYALFENVNNRGVGIRCASCETSHPFLNLQIMWIPRSAGPKRSNDIAAVIEECGAYCYFCGWAFDRLAPYHIGAAVHPTLPFASHGETSKKIPVCVEGHELANFQQRVRIRMAKIEEQQTI